MAFLRIGRGSVIVGVVGGGQSRSGGGGTSFFGVLQCRCGCCLVGLAGVEGGFFSGRSRRDHSPAEGAALDLRLALSPTNSIFKGLFSLVQHCLSVGL